MLPLPILNIRLNACHENWQQMTPVAQGHHCAQCNRTVLDFTAASQADVDAAFRASADGRVCGRFRAGQLAPTPPLRPKLRRFLVALVLVCGVGLSGREAVAQVVYDTARHKPYVPRPFGIVVEQMPVFKGGNEALLSFIKQNIHRPDAAPQTLNGRVFIHFQVTEVGAIRDVTVVKSLHPALDAEAVRVVQLLDGKFTPGRQNNRPVSVAYTIPITFQEADVPSKTNKRKPR